MWSLKRMALRAVEVGDWLPSYGVLPMGLPAVWDAFYLCASLPRARLLPLIGCTNDRYLKMLTLSLYFFNLLPLPFLDGGQLFDVLQDWWERRPEPRRGPSAAAPGGEDEEDIPLGALEGGADASETARRRSTTARSADMELRMARRRRAVHVGVGTLMGACVAMSLASAYF